GQAQHVAVAPRTHHDAPRVRPRFQPVLGRVLDEGLEERVRHARVEHVGRDVPRKTQPVAEAHLLDLGV
ncbi:MAG: hypothetical protein AVDCRST_MAG40-19, partial [uncultured Gemmatimonadaceae bacterium]